jgi:thioredoxin reductase (NADPH)
VYDACDAHGVADRGLARLPQSFAADRQLRETSRQGVFVIGNIRSGSVERVAAAIGDGAHWHDAACSFDETQIVKPI